MRTVVIITEHALILEHDELDLQRTKRIKEETTYEKMKEELRLEEPEHVHTI